MKEAFEEMRRALDKWFEDTDGMINELLRELMVNQKQAKEREENRKGIVRGSRDRDRDRERKRKRNGMYNESNEEESNEEESTEEDSSDDEGIEEDDTEEEESSKDESNG